MRRLHLFEWQDQAWLPRVFRDFITDHLRCTQDEPMRHPVNVAVAKRLKELMERVHKRRIIDLCAGSAGYRGLFWRLIFWGIRRGEFERTVDECFLAYHFISLRKRILAAE